ncbi:hypothetical protein Prudu_012410, partial [Prunus dulcis]
SKASNPTQPRPTTSKLEKSFRTAASLRLGGEQRRSFLLLPELPPIQVYRCGGCGVPLQAKALLLMPAGYKASVSSALSYTALFFRFFPFTAYGLNHFRSLQSPFFILNSNLNLCKPWHASSPQQSQSLQTSQRWRSFDYSSASAEVGLMESYREKRRDLHIVFIELEKIYDRGSNDSSLGDYNEQINVASVPGSVDSNPSVSPLASISARVGSDDFNPRVSTDYDDSGTLASAVGPSGSNPPGSVAINIGLQVENNDPHHRTRVTALELTFMLVGFNLEILSAGFDQISSTSKPRYALISLLLAVAVDETQHLTRFGYAYVLGEQQQ